MFAKKWYPLRSTLSAGLRTVNHSSFSTRAATQIGASKIYDVVCIGGGPAGLSLLATLNNDRRTSHLKTALIDRQDLSGQVDRFKQTDGFSNRCSSITPSSVEHLKNIGAWKHIDTTRIQPFQAMHVWDGISDAKIDFDPDGMTQSNAYAPFWSPRSRYWDNNVATMTENGNLTSALLTRIKELNGTRMVSNTAVEDITFGQETEEMDLRSWPVVKLSNKEEIAARLLIGADGFESPARRFADIKSRGWDYNRNAVVATLELSEEEEVRRLDFRTAYQRFLPTGPVAMLPLPGNKATLVWSTTPEHASRLKQLLPNDLSAMVNAAFRLLPVDIDYMLTKMSSSGQAEEYSWRKSATSFSSLNIPPTVVDIQSNSVASFPLRMRHADTYIGDRIALIGDAAHTIHPLAGQGLNQGLGDAKSLAECIAYATEVGWDIGCSFTLDRYNADRWIRNNAMLGVVDKLHKLYSVESGPLVWARSAGLNMVNRLDGVKRGLMGFAAGQ